MQAADTESSWLPTVTTATRDAAALYIEHGLRVVIVHGIRDDGSCTCGKPGTTCRREKPGKHPSATAWQKQKYETVEAFRDALDARGAPDPANLGIAMGEQPNGDYVLAVDADDAARMAALEAALGPLPVTLTARSGGGNNHRVYSLGMGQDPKRMKNRTGVRLEGEKPTPGVDVKVAGGQIVVCPSLHASGERYSWAVMAPIAELPQRWYDAIADAAPVPEPVTKTRAARPVVNLNDHYVAKVIENAAADISGRGKGERNGVLFSKTCTVLEYCAGAGIAFDRALDELRIAGTSCGLPRGEVDEVLRKAERHVRSSGKTRVPPPSSPRTVPPGRPPEAAVEVPAATDDAWMSELTRGQQGGIKSTFGNVCLILRHEEGFKGRLSYNRMRIAPFIRDRGGDRPLEDADVARIREDIERRWGFSPANEAVIQAILLIASERSFHPLQDYLGGLTWDGEARIARVTAEVLGGSADDALTQRMLRCWFISAAARALAPGCKVDTTLVLVGEQGYRKSTFFSVLGGEWFSDTYVDIRNKDGILQIHAAWLHEWAEIERVTIKTSSSDVKAFLTSARDSVRPPFGRGVLIQPRSSVIVGTTNKAFIDDETGSRRFWPVHVNSLVDVALLAQWRDQLWAEAVAALKAGEVWWLTAGEDAAREDAAEDHMVENTWVVRMADYLADPSRRTTGVTIAEVLVGSLGVDLGRADRGEATRAGKAMRRLGWWSRQETRSGVRVRVHYPRGQIPGCTT